MAAGRVRGVAVSNVSVVVAQRSQNRIAITFSVGEATNASSVIVRNHEDATTTNGFPISVVGGPLRIEGVLAKHRWSAIRLAAVDCTVGVIEEFSDDFFDADVPLEGEASKP